jgi:hypothetical protein
MHEVADVRSVVARYRPSFTLSNYIALERITRPATAVARPSCARVRYGSGERPGGLLKAQITVVYLAQDSGHTAQNSCQNRTESATLNS